MDNNNMKIIKSKTGEVYMCHMNGKNIQSTIRQDVETWRDEQMKHEAEYNKILNSATQAYYNDKTFNYKGD